MTFPFGVFGGLQFKIMEAEFSFSCDVPGTIERSRGGLEGADSPV